MIKFILKYSLLLLLFLSQITAFGQKNKVNPNGYNVFYYPNGQISSEGWMKNGKPDGLWKNFYKTGVRKSIGKRSLSLLDSTWVFFNTQGDTTDIINYYRDNKSGYHFHYEYIKSDSDTVKLLKFKELYVENKKAGKSFYYEKNHLKRIVNYENNIPDGWAYEYSYDTLITKMLEYKNGFLVYSEKINRFDKDTLKQGVWKYFYPDGKIMREENYLHGQLNGFYKEYDPRGKLVKMIKYVYGQPMEESIKEDSIFTEKKQFFENGNIKNTGYYKYDSIPVGAHKEYDIEGIVTTVRMYDNDGILEAMGLFDSKARKTGQWKEFFPTGEIRAEGNYKSGKKTGKWTFYFHDQKVEQTGYFYRGKYDKTWNWYLHSGKLFQCENYYHGKLDGYFFQLTETGDTLLSGNYSDGDKTGKWHFYIGDQIEEGKYEGGYKEGLWTIYNKDNKKIIFKGNFVQGALNDKVYYYYNNGKLKRLEQYRLGVPTGNWQYYDFDQEGHIILIENYRAGKLRKIDGVRFKWPKPMKQKRRTE
ncbi:MAG: hypothetical protein J7L46_00445 [Bacteroidales bacterium]|nr:hypothetical protein [Bacteroidales bacterium]